MKGQDFLIKALMDRLEIPPEMIEQAKQIPPAIVAFIKNSIESQQRIEARLLTIELALNVILENTRSPSDTPEENGVSRALASRAYSAEEQQQNAREGFKIIA